ncbi:hypothetical protein T12_16131 [Trichinella patagoniensis]|uniref:Uncharacterized protein n=1 Tax=Trichinella patagoniensis TaxID=990121 RepID=A0A0V1AFY9_9BILA|nr:hypothetical protein T12_16131 [Trichinella patagoniensis]
MRDVYSISMSLAVQVRSIIMLKCFVLIIVPFKRDGCNFAYAVGNNNNNNDNDELLWPSHHSRLCFSCASENYHGHWQVLSKSLRPPTNFTVLCRQPLHAPFLAVTSCPGPCVTIVEDEYIFATSRLFQLAKSKAQQRVQATDACVSSFSSRIQKAFRLDLRVRVDQSYIRGCAESMFLAGRKDFVPHAMTTAENFCNLLPRQMLLLLDSGQRRDELVTVCFCAYDRCNVYPDQTVVGSGTTPSPWSSIGVPLYVPLFWALYNVISTSHNGSM